MASVYRKGRPEYIPITLILETSAEYHAMLEILREAQRENTWGKSKVCPTYARSFEDLLNSFFQSS